MAVLAQTVGLAKGSRASGDSTVKPGMFTGADYTQTVVFSGTPRALISGFLALGADAGVVLRVWWVRVGVHGGGTVVVGYPGMVGTGDGRVLGGHRGTGPGWCPGCCTVLATVLYCTGHCTVLHRPLYHPRPATVPP